MSRKTDSMPELSPEAREIIDAAIDADGPTDADRERLRGAVFAAIAGGGAATAASSAAEATTTAASAGEAASWGTVGAEAVTNAGGLSTLAKVTIVAALVGGATGLYLAASSSDEPTSEQPAPTIAPPPAPEPAPTPDPAPTDVVPEPDPAPTDVVPEPDPEPVKKTTPAPAPKKATPAPKPAPLTGVTTNGLEQERALLDLATDALRSGRPSRALELVAESEELFPDARLGPERAATRVLALCALSRTDSKRREAASSALERFRRAHPKSPLLVRINRACQATPPAP